ncbi:MAG: PKD domain-containing protein [Bacteroidetes bacterium]|nr:PKD domain-containing protein [Bacteroidota bacterium]
MKASIVIVFLCYFWSLNLLAQNDGQWHPITERFMVNVDTSWNFGDIRSLFAYENKLYVSGAFNRMINQDTMVADQLAYLDTIWRNIDNSPGASNAMTFHNGDLYLGGNDIQPFVGIMKHDTGWSVLGPPTPIIVKSLKEYHDTLFVGGNFGETSSYGENIAGWDDTAWIDVGHLRGSGSDDVINLEVGMLNGKEVLFAAGDFEIAGDWPNGNYTNKALNLAFWDGNNWNAFDSVKGSYTQVLFYDTVMNHLYISGDFIAVGNVQTAFLALWDGNKWIGFGNDLDCGAAPNAMITYHGELYLGGCFTKADSIIVNGLARWDGKHWKDLDGGTNVGGGRFAVFRDTLYVGGFFQTVGSNNDTSIALAKWYTPPCAYLKAAIDTFFQDSNVVSFKDASAGLWKTKWVWDFGDGSIDSSQHPSHTYQAPGLYQVRLKVSHGECIDSVHIGVLVPGSSADVIESSLFSDGGLSMSIDPNPSNNNWQIKIQGPGFKDQKGMIRIYNTAGQEVITEPVSSTQMSFTIDVRGLEAGVYICSFEVNGEVVVSQKTVVK